MNGYTFTNVQTGDAILATHVTTLNSAASELISQFNTAVTGKLTLFTPTTAAASLNFPSSGEPTSPVAGDVWRASDVLKFQSSTGSKTIAFLDSAFSSGLNVSAGTSTFAGTASFTNTVSVATTDASAVTIRKESSGTRIAVFNTSTNYLDLLNGSSLRVNATDTPSGNGVFSVAGATGNVTTAGSINATGALNAGNTTITGTLGVSNAISRNGTAYSTPELLNAAGFTINIGNGIDTISNGVQLPVVVIPYACNIEYWMIALSDNVSKSISMTVQRRALADSGYTEITLLNSTVLVLNNGTRAAASVANVALSQGDILRVSVASGATATRAALHLRVRRS